MPPSPSPSPLWPATLHHLALLSPDADRLAGCLGAALQMRCERSEDGCSVLTGPDRRITIQPGAASGALHLGYALDDVERVAGLQSRFARRGIRTESSGVPFFRTGSFRVAAPDGVALVFGVPAAHAQTTDLEGLSGRLPARRVPYPGARAAPLFPHGRSGIRAVRSGGGRRRQSHGGFRSIRSGASLVRGFPCLATGVRITLLSRRAAGMICATGATISRTCGCPSGGVRADTARATTSSSWSAIPTATGSRSRRKWSTWIRMPPTGSGLRRNAPSTYGGNAWMRT